jgi:hypothetical protein
VSDFFADLETHLLAAAERGPRSRLAASLPRPRRVVLVVALVAALAAVLALALPAGREERSAAPPPHGWTPYAPLPDDCTGDYAAPTPALRGRLGVLQRPPTAADRIPPRLERTGMPPSGLVNPAHVRLALTDTVGRRFYVLPTAITAAAPKPCAVGAGSACVRAVGPDDRLLGQACDAASTLEDVPVFEVTRSEPPLAFGLAPDGVSDVVVTARSGPGGRYAVVANVWSGRMTFRPVEARFERR